MTSKDSGLRTQESEVGRSEVGRSEVGGRKSEGQKSEVGSRRSEGRKSEVGSRKSEVGRILLVDAFCKQYGSKNCRLSDH